MNDANKPVGKPNPENVERLLDRLKTRLPFLPNDLNVETPLNQLDFDSLDRVELFCAMSDELGTKMDLQQFQSARTIGDVIDLISSPKGDAHVVR